MSQLKTDDQISVKGRVIREREGNVEAVLTDGQFLRISREHVKPVQQPAGKQPTHKAVKGPALK
jgi:hypothetical protein